ncbi:MAG: AAA family ATPase [Planctomycetota bacterium]|nr:MAG: AAA family ATPase [Planctomycetota bacterium]
MTHEDQIQREVENFQKTWDEIRDAVHARIVGQDRVVDGVLVALLAGGNVLLEGVPGIGKTLLVRSLGEALHVEQSRIQFTPDLMPSDVLGTMVIDEAAGGSRSLRFQEGPIHANLVLADEINRATPKTQSALLEAMQERQVTIAGTTRPLPEPFIVLATQNPVEQEGTYPLPEAQLDRFLFKLVVGYPEEDEYGAILGRSTGREMPEVPRVASAEDIQAMRQLVRDVPVTEEAERLAVQLVMATQPNSPYASERVNRFVMLGSSPRGAQALVLSAKVHALSEGRFAATPDDVRAWAVDSLRHRVLLGFEALAENVSTDDLVLENLERLDLR